MHPLHAELTARMVAEERHRRAEVARRLHAAAPVRPTMRERVGGGLIALGTRLQDRRPTATPRTASC